MYTAVILDEESKSKLKNTFPTPEGWVTKCHHMTIKMGKTQNPNILGKEVELKVVSFATNNLVMAAGVECEIPSTNKQKHITIAVNEKNGGTPKMSNTLTNWKKIPPIILKGTVQEVN